MGGMGTYLGIPEDISGSKCKLFAFLKEKLDHRINGWSGRWLSKAGKEVLIKAIALALPTYVMSSFLLPLEVCEKLASAIARYWWSTNPPKKGMHWAAWEKLCKPKDEGGLGFRLIHEFNLALLAKQLWRIIQFPDSLMARVMRGRYFKYSSPLRVSSAANPSYIWSSLMAAKPLLLLGVRRKIHSGFQTRVWEDPWVPMLPSRPARAMAPVVHPRMTVSDLINGDNKSWDDEKLALYVDSEDISKIKSLAISQFFSPDRYCWDYNRSGMYTVKSGYWVARNILKEQEINYLEPSVTRLQEQAWKLHAPHKMKHLVWQVASGYLAVTGNLTRRHMRCDNHCPRCGAEDETINHAIFECPPALQTWAIAATPTPPNTFPIGSVFTNLDFLFWRKNVIEDPLMDRDPYPWIISYIWKARNDKLFRGIDRDPVELVRFAQSECNAWFEANAKLNKDSDNVLLQQTQTTCLEDLCRVDGSWTPDAVFSGVGFMYKEGGRTNLMGMRNKQRLLSPLHVELDALIWAMEAMLQHTTCQHFGTDSMELITMIKNPEDWPAFSTELMELHERKRRFEDFKLIHVPRSRNAEPDALAKTARAFPRSLSFIGCSFPVWIPRPPHV